MTLYVKSPFTVFILLIPHDRLLMSSQRNQHELFPPQHVLPNFHNLDQTPILASQENCWCYTDLKALSTALVPVQPLFQSRFLAAASAPVRESFFETLLRLTRHHRLEPRRPIGRDKQNGPHCLLQPTKVG